MSQFSLHYQEFRDRLVALLQRSLRVPQLNERSADDIAAANRKLLENQFELVLIGEFQGGKSTTFNNLCDGREISPRGKSGGGLKTSACIIRALNLANDDAEEFAEVRWRTVDEILMGFDVVLDRYLLSLNQAARVNQPNFDANSADGEPAAVVDGHFTVPTFDLETEVGRQAIREAAKHEIAVWETDKANYDPEDVGLIDLVRFALVASTYYNHPYMKQMREQSRFSIQDVSRLVVFPEDWQTRWESWDETLFRPEELIFAFVAQVNCHIHSPNLARLGCAVTDCPGLFASSWDSKVAADALSRADAVLYLITGDRQLSQSDLKAIKTLEIGKGMIFVGANCKSSSWQKADRILKANVALLTQQGLDIQPCNVQPYHAGLALYARQMLNGVSHLDERSLQVLKQDLNLDPDAELTAVCKKLKRQIRRFRENLDEADLDDDDQASVWKESLEKSRLHCLIQAIENFILSKRAEAILQTNAGKVIAALKETEASLKLIEHQAAQAEAASLKEFHEADHALQEFESVTKVELQDLGQSAPKYLAASFSNQIEASKPVFLERLIKELGERVRKAAGRIKWNADTFKEEVAHLEQQAQEEFNNWFREELLAWRQKILRGENQEVIQRIQNPANEFVTKARSYWDQIQDKHLVGLDGILLPAIHEIELHTHLVLPDSFMTVIRSTLMDRAQEEGRIVAGGVGVGVAVVVLVLTPVLTAMALVFLLPVLALFHPRVRDLILNNDDKKLQGILDEKFLVVQRQIEQALELECEKYVRELQDQIEDKVLAHPRRIFQQRKDEAEALYRLNNADRIAKAKAAEEARVQHIQPLRRDYESFVADLGRVFGEAS